MFARQSKICIYFCKKSSRYSSLNLKRNHIINIGLSYVKIFEFWRKTNCFLSSNTVSNRYKTQSKFLKKRHVLPRQIDYCQLMKTSKKDLKLFFITQKLPKDHKVHTSHLLLSRQGTALCNSRRSAA